MMAVAGDKQARIAAELQVASRDAALLEEMSQEAAGQRDAVAAQLERSRLLASNLQQQVDSGSAAVEEVVSYFYQVC